MARARVVCLPRPSASGDRVGQTARRATLAASRTATPVERVDGLLCAPLIVRQPGPSRTCPASPRLHAARAPKPLHRHGFHEGGVLPSRAFPARDAPSGGVDGEPGAAESPPAARRRHVRRTARRDHRVPSSNHRVAGQDGKRAGTAICHNDRVEGEGQASAAIRAGSQVKVLWQLRKAEDPRGRLLREMRNLSDRHRIAAATPRPRPGRCPGCGRHRSTRGRDPAAVGHTRRRWTRDRSGTHTGDAKVCRQGTRRGCPHGHGLRGREQAALASALRASVPRGAVRAAR